MEKKKHLSRAALIVSNAIAINKFYGRQKSSKFFPGKENEPPVSVSGIKRSSRTKVNRRLFGESYMTSTPKKTRKVQCSNNDYCGYTCNVIIICPL